MAGDQRVDGYSIPPGPRIPINAKTQDGVDSDALEQQDRRRDERISTVWGKLFGDTNLRKMLPISYKFKEGDYSYLNCSKTDDHVSLPLVGGGEIRIGKIVSEKEENYTGQLVIGVTTHDPHGDLVTLPDVKVNGTYDMVVVDRSTNDRLSGLDVNVQYGTKKTEVRRVKNFLALFDPTKDIDTSQPFTGI